LIVTFSNTQNQGLFENSKTIQHQPLKQFTIFKSFNAHDGENIASHDAIQDVFASIVRDARFHVLKLFINELTLFCQLMAFAQWLMSSLSTPLEQN